MARAKGVLNAALKKDSALRELVKPGLSAFEKNHLRLILEDQRSRIAESLDLDEASRNEFPDSTGLQVSGS